jgi:hypothetical protein
MSSHLTRSPILISVFIKVVLNRNEIIRQAVIQKCLSTPG